MEFEELEKYIVCYNRMLCGVKLLAVDWLTGKFIIQVGPFEWQYHPKINPIDDEETKIRKGVDEFMRFLKDVETGKIMGTSGG